MTTDRELAPLFLGRGLTFIAGAREADAQAFSDEIVLSNVCWGLELVLKGLLLSHGVSDDHNRRIHGHDLLKTAAAGRDFGLALDPDALSFLTDIAPYARRHAIDEALAKWPDFMRRHHPLQRAADIVHEVKRAGGEGLERTPGPPL